jgi:hypothetical protein
MAWSKWRRLEQATFSSVGRGGQGPQREGRGGRKGRRGCVEVGGGRGRDGGATPNKLLASPLPFLKPQATSPAS